MNNYINIVCICLAINTFGRCQIQYYAINELTKILEEFPAGEEEYPGRLLPAKRNTN
jgi:hypothetical protein